MTVIERAADVIFEATSRHPFATDGPLDLSVWRQSSHWYAQVLADAGLLRIVSAEPAPADTTGEDRTTVCVVTERHRDHHGQRRSLYGVFRTEAEARHEYGDVEPPYDVSFDVVTLFGEDRTRDARDAVVEAAKAETDAERRWIEQLRPWGGMVSDIPVEPEPTVKSTRNARRAAVDALRAVEADQEAQRVVEHNHAESWPCDAECPAQEAPGE